MQLNHITGNSYYLDGESAVGVYVFPDYSCLLIDSGHSESHAKKIMDVLSEQGLKVQVIFNTHAHVDHCGGNANIQAQNQCRIIASPQAAVVIENPLLGPAMLFGAYPLRVLRSRAIMAHSSKVDKVVQPGYLIINNMEFHVLDLPGHSFGHLGLVTPDEVAFLGDGLMHEKMLADYPFLYVVDITSQLATLDLILQSSWSKVFITHGGLVDDLALSVKNNQNRISRITDEIMTLIETSRSREEILAAMIKIYNLRVNSAQYYLVSATISAFLSHLCQQKKLHNRVEDGVMKFSRSIQL